MFRVAVCDDDEKVLEDLKNVIEQEYPQNIQVVLVKEVENYIKQLEAKKELIPDIVIMDIQWDEKGKKGIDYSVQIQKAYPKVKIIFLTGFVQYAPDIFMARPSHFLVKPIRTDKLREALDRVIEEISADRRTQIALCTSEEVVKINPSYVFYIESEKHNLYFHGVNGKKKFRMKMDDCLEIFPDSFIRIHQSYSVNGAYLQSIKGDTAILSDGSNLPVSRKRYKTARQQFLKYLEGK